MMNRMKRWLYSKLHIYFGDEVSFLKPTKTEATCTRDAETRKRVAKAFEEQAQQMQTRAMKAHDPKCQDPLSCKKTFCYVWECDKIVKVEEVKRRGRPKKVDQ